MQHIETDYLIIGSGAAGLAFADTLIDESSAHITLVDRHGKPGGHWNDAYSFVTLHQPSAFYGVNSMTLGANRKDTVGANKGLYELASGPEVSGYFDRVMNQKLLPSGRVSYHPMCNYLGGDAAGHRFVSILSGAETQVTVRKKLIDATYYSPTVPSTHTPKYHVGAGVRLVTPNALAHLWQGKQERAKHFMIIGAGKTAMDVGVWLLNAGAQPDDISWVTPRDSWLVNRLQTQPGAEFFDDAIGGQANQMEAFAKATMCSKPSLRRASISSTDRAPKLAWVKNRAALCALGRASREGLAGSAPGALKVTTFASPAATGSAEVAPATAPRPPPPPPQAVSAGSAAMLSRPGNAVPDLAGRPGWMSREGVQRDRGAWTGLMRWGLCSCCFQVPTPSSALQLLCGTQYHKILRNELFVFVSNWGVPLRAVPDWQKIQVKNGCSPRVNCISSYIKSSILLFLAAAQYKGHLEADAVFRDFSFADDHLLVLHPGPLDVGDGFRCAGNADGDGVFKAFFAAGGQFKNFGNGHGELRVIKSF